MKQKLFGLITAGRDQEASDLLPHVSDTPPDQPGKWTAKDQLAHLTAWRQVNAAEINALRTGGAHPVVSDDDDVENARIYAKTHPIPAAQILEGANTSWDQLRAAIEACTDDDLARPRRRRPDQQLWQVIPNNTYFHLAEHLGYWHADHGDETGAEQAAKWGHDLAIATFPDDRTRGVAAYNLGCFYAKRGRADDAMPYLRTGITLRPELRDWARTDRDLDLIRSTPGVVSLLG